MKKQDTSSLRSSSFRQENSPKNLQAKSIGCMSGIFHLIYKYNNRRRKFITSGKKQEKNIIISSVSSSSKLQEENNFVVGNNNNDFTRLTCDERRSPTLPAEIRRRNDMKTAEMGFLQEAAEKRRKLIEALEKCNEDLKELKKIIDVVKSSVSVSVVDNQDDNYKINGDLQPSPVSVLDGFNPLSSALSGGGGGGSYHRSYTNGGAEQPQTKQKQKKKPGEEDIIMNNMSNICLVEKMKSETRKVEEGKSCACMMNENYVTAVISRPNWGSKAMIDSVNEVCKDIAWGETREIGRIGLALQDHICRDLIDEFVKELGSFCFYSLPFEACRRRIRFL